LWFVENETACRDFIKASKKGFTSLTALQSAMKPKADPKPKAETPVQPEADDKSNVGLDSEAEQAETKSASDIAMQALLDCEMNGISKASFLAALKEQLEMLDAANTKAAA